MKLFTLEDIDRIKILDYAYFKDDNLYTIKVLQNIGLLRVNQTCNCGGKLYVILRSDISDGSQFKCDKCSKRQSLRKGSIFEMSKLPLWKSFILFIIFIKFPEMKYENISINLDISSYSTIFEWKMIIRDIMINILDKEFTKIGGQDVIVQIDETAISKRKYNIGRILKNQQFWMIGGIDENGNCFLKISKIRNKKTLENIICNNVEEGSRIWTDGWKGYNSLESLGFTHGVVIHKRNFVSSVGVHTNRIEATWGAFKRKYRNATNKNPESLPGYVADFIFRRKYVGEEISKICKYLMNLYVNYE